MQEAIALLMKELSRIHSEEKFEDDRRRALMDDLNKAVNNIKELRQRAANVVSAIDALKTREEATPNV